MQQFDIHNWIDQVISGKGGFLSWELNEMAVHKVPREQAIAAFVIRCLANRCCKGSKEVLQEIIAEREKYTDFYTATETECRGCMGPCGRCDEKPCDRLDKIQSISGLIESMKNKAEQNMANYQEPDAADWVYQEGVLLTNDEALNIYKAVFG